MSVLSWLSWENPVAIWWVVLSSASCVNILFWYWTFRFRISKDSKVMIRLSGIYVFVCAFRSFLPRADVQRICLYDTWFSSVLVGRTMATFAELAFVTQWAIVVRFLAYETQNNTAAKLSFLFFPLIAIAECFSWYAVIRTHYLGNAVEESLWAVTYSLITISLLLLLPKLTGALKLAAQFSVLGCVLYICFMIFVDVPMYVTRLMSDSQSQKPLFGFLEGINDLNTRWIVTRQISDWKSEIPWQTLYFTFAVFVSVALCYVPLNHERLKKYLKNSN